MNDYYITLKHKDFMYLLEHCTYHPKNNLWPIVALDSNICSNCGAKDTWHYDNKLLTVSCASCGHNRTDMYLSGSAVPSKEGGGGEVGWMIPSVIFLDENDEKHFKKNCKKARKEVFVWKIKNQPSLLWSECLEVVKTIKSKIASFFTQMEK